MRELALHRQVRHHVRHEPRDRDADHAEQQSEQGVVGSRMIGAGDHEDDGKPGEGGVDPLAEIRADRPTAAGVEEAVIAPLHRGSTLGGCRSRGRSVCSGTVAWFVG